MAHDGLEELGAGNDEVSVVSPLTSRLGVDSSADRLHAQEVFVRVLPSTLRELIKGFIRCHSLRETTTYNDCSRLIDLHLSKEVLIRDCIPMTESSRTVLNYKLRAFLRAIESVGINQAQLRDFMSRFSNLFDLDESKDFLDQDTRSAFFAYSTITLPPPPSSTLLSLVNSLRLPPVSGQNFGSAIVEPPSHPAPTTLPGMQPPVSGAIFSSQGANGSGEEGPVNIGDIAAMLAPGVTPPALGSTPSGSEKTVVFSSLAGASSSAEHAATIPIPQSLGVAVDNGAHPTAQTVPAPASSMPQPANVSGPRLTVGPSAPTAPTAGSNSPEEITTLGATVNTMGGGLQSATSAPHGVQRLTRSRVRTAVLGTLLVGTVAAVAAGFYKAPSSTDTTDGDSRPTSALTSKDDTDFVKEQAPDITNPEVKLAVAKDILLGMQADILAQPTIARNEELQALFVGYFDSFISSPDFQTALSRMQTPDQEALDAKLRSLVLQELKYYFKNNGDYFASKALSVEDLFSQ